MKKELVVGKVEDELPPFWSGTVNVRGYKTAPQQANETLQAIALHLETMKKRERLIQKVRGTVPLLLRGQGRWLTSLARAETRR